MSCADEFVRLDLMVNRMLFVITIVFTPLQPPPAHLTHLCPTPSRGFSRSIYFPFGCISSNSRESHWHDSIPESASKWPWTREFPESSQRRGRCSVRPSFGAEARRYASRMSPRIVNTQYGKLRGILMTLPRKDLSVVEGFFGLPYASVLGGELRFMPPTAPMEKWEEVRVAIDFKPVCPQKKPNIEELEVEGMPRVKLEFYKRMLPFLENQHEECLNLNIYLPFRAKNDTDLLPVILFIHGESFETGTGNAYDGSVMAAFGHVMVVTMNYRLGVLGFLSTDDSNALGNYATLDQVAALHWIKENIHSFGGNPNDVTIFGHSYGAALTNILLISPVTRDKNLFKRVILYDGSILGSWAVTEDPMSFTRELAEKVNCSTFSEQTIRLVSCLKQIPWEQLVTVIIPAPNFFSSFGPTTDGKSILPEDARHLIMTSSTFSAPLSSLSASHSTEFSSKPSKNHVKVPPIPLILGCSRQAGHKFLSQPELETGVQGIRMKQRLRTLIRNTYTFHRQKIYDIVAYHYGEWEKPRNKKAVGSSLAQLLGDNQIAAPLVKLARSRLQSWPTSETYFFAFGHGEIDEKQIHLQKQQIVTASNGSFIRSSGTHHKSEGRPRSAFSHQSNGYAADLSDTNFEDGDLMAYLFGAPLVDNLDPFQTTYSKNEKALAEILLRYWSNFAKTGNPNNGGKSEGTSRDVTSWPLYRQEEQEYMSFVSKGSHGSLAIARHHYRGAKMGLWLDLIPKIHRSDNLERRFHLLDDYENKSTFEERGTKEVNWTDHIARRILNHTMHQTSFRAKLSTSEAEFFEQSDKNSDNFGKMIKPEDVRRAQTELGPAAKQNITNIHSANTLGNTKNIISINFSTVKLNTKTQGSKLNTEVESHNQNVSLRATIIVGSALLALNAIIFLCMCRQKRKTNRTLTQLKKRNVVCQNQSCVCSEQREVGKKTSSIKSGGGSARSVAMKSCSSKSTFDCIDETLSQISCNSSGSVLSGKTDDVKHIPTCRDNRVTQLPPLSHPPLFIQQFQPLAQNHQHQGSVSSVPTHQQKVVQFRIPDHDGIACKKASTADQKSFDYILNTKDKYHQPDVPSSQIEFGLAQICELVQDAPRSLSLTHERDQKSSTIGPSRSVLQRSQNTDISYGPDPSTIV